MPQLKTPTATATATPANGNGDHAYARTLNGVNSALDSLKEIYDVRLDAMDKAISVAHEDLVRVPTEVDKAVVSLDKILTERFNTVAERFAGVEKQLAERSTHMIEKSDLVQKAMDAALLAADKAVTKSESSVRAVEANLNDKNAFALAQIARLDNMLVAMAATRTGRTEQASDTWARLVGAAAVGAALIGLIQFLIK